MDEHRLSGPHSQPRSPGGAACVRQSELAPLPVRFPPRCGIMAALSSKALHEQLSVIMEALTKAAVAEICEVVDEGYAVLQLEISRSRQENDALRKKLHLIESIVVRGTSGEKTSEPEDAAAAEDAPQQRQQQRDADGGGAAVPQAELPEVVLIKDEDSDSNDGFDEENQTCVDGGTTSVKEAVTSTQVSHCVMRHHPGNDETETSPSSSSEHLALKAPRKTSVYTVDSPHSEPGCSAQLGADEVETSESVCSFSSQMDTGVHVVHQENSLVPPSSNRQTYFSGGSSAIEHQSDGGDMDLSLSWTKPSKHHMSFAHFHQNENMDVDAFGLKLISISGSTSTDCQLSESSNSAFEYEDADMSFGLYRDQSARCPPLGAGGRRFICSVCSKTYATSQNLDVHMRIHTGERPFSCSQCGKKFTQSAHLKSHMSVHTGERPYACGVCARSFIVKYSLKLHMKKCHPHM